MSWHVVDTIEPWMGSRLVTDDEYYSMLLQGIILSATPTSDAVVPGSLIPATAGEVGALSDQITNFIHVEINVKDAAYGAKGDGVTDDYAAIQAAITATQATSRKGGVIRLPAGTYICGTFLDFRGAENVIFEGVGGRTAGAGAATILKYTGPDAANFVDLRSTIGCGIRDMQIIHSGNFTGRVVDFRNALGAGLLALATAYAFVENCYIGGNTSYKTAIGIDVDNSTRISIQDVAFYQLSICIRGRSLTTFSNIVSIERCGFNQYSTMAIRNPGQSWSVRDCTFEGTSGVATAASMDHDAGIYAEALLVEGCWTGDSVGGTQFVVSGYGINFRSNWLGATSGTAIAVDEFATGLNVQGNRFYSNSVGISMSTHASNKKHFFTGNAYDAVTTRYSGTVAPGIYADDTLGTLVLTGPITLTDGANISPGTTAGTEIGTTATQKLGFWGTTPVVRPVLAYSRSHEVSTNVLLNGSFDSNLTSWSTGGGVFNNTLNGSLTRITTDYNPVDDSSHACADIVYGAGTNQQGIWQAISGLPALTTVYASVWIKNISGRPVWLRLKDLTNSGTTVNSSTATSGSGWTLITSNVTTGTSAAQVEFAIATDTTLGAGEFYVDDARMGSVTTAETAQTADLRAVLATMGLITDSTVA
jgi:hypothetical protein